MPIFERGRVVVALDTARELLVHASHPETVIYNASLIIAVAASCVHLASALLAESTFCEGFAVACMTRPHLAVLYNDTMVIVRLNRRDTSVMACVRLAAGIARRAGRGSSGGAAPGAVRCAAVAAAGTRAISLDDVPAREEQVAALRSREFDVLVIGGGATGAGCAVEAATRGAQAARRGVRGWCMC